MRIAQVCLRFLAPGGVESHVYNLSKELHKKGHEVQIFTTNLYTEKPWKLIDYPDPVLEFAKINRYRVYKDLIPFLKMPIAPALLKGILEYSPDIVHLHSHRYFHVILGSLLTAKYPVVVSTHYHPPEQKETMWARAMLNFQDLLFKAFVYNQVEAVISHEGEIESMRNFLGGVNSYVIPAGIDPEEYKIAPNEEGFRNAYKIEGEYIIYAGRLASNKGLLYLVKAFASIEKKMHVKLVLMGEESGYGEVLKRLINEYSIKNVIFTGFVKERDLYLGGIKGSSLFVLPSEWEAFGISVIEAYMMSRPVITSDRGGLKYLGEIGGHVVPYGDVKALSEAIVKILTNKKESFIKAEKAKEYVLSHYTWNIVANEVESVYKKVVNQYGRKHAINGY